MAPSEFVGEWVIERTASVGVAGAEPTRWRKARSPSERIVIANDGTFARELHGRPQPGRWTVHGGVLALVRDGFDPLHATLNAGRIELREADEEHGGLRARSPERRRQSLNRSTSAR